jgi:polar amino acid transport system substrate-binding protein
MIRILVLCAGAYLLPLTTAAAAELRLVTAELPPYTFHEPPPTVSEFGTPMGIVYEVVREMAARVGHSGQIDFMSWMVAQDVAIRGPNVGILSLTRSPEREPQYIWAQKIVTDDLVLVGGTGVDVSSLDRVKDRPIGVLARSGAEALLRSLGFSRIEPAAEEWMNAEKMRERRLDAWLAPRLMVIYAYKEVGGNPATLNIGQIVRQSEIYLAMSKDVAPAEVSRWQEAFRTMADDGTYNRIRARYDRMRVDPIPDEKRRYGIDWSH